MNISNTELARGAIPYFVCFEQPGKNHTLFNVERGERTLDDSEYRHRRPNSSVGVIGTEIRLSSQIYL